MATVSKASAHWEGDLFFGSHNSQIATLVERQTRYVMLVRVASKDSATVIDAREPRLAYSLSAVCDDAAMMWSGRRMASSSMNQAAIPIRPRY